MSTVLVWNPCWTLTSEESGTRQQEREIRQIKDVKKGFFFPPPPKKKLRLCVDSKRAAKMQRVRRIDLRTFF